MNVVSFKWKDAALYGTQVLDRKEIAEVSLKEMLSGGILLREDKDTIVICSDYDHEGSTGRGVGIYPKALISHITRHRR